jgi:hypothetical protein
MGLVLQELVNEVVDGSRQSISGQAKTKEQGILREREHGPSTEEVYQIEDVILPSNFFF